MKHSEMSFFADVTSEDVRTEFKRCEAGRLSQAVQKTISAFSNTEGGTVVLGVSDTGEDIGLSSSALDKLQTDVASVCKSVFNVPVHPDIQRVGGRVNVHIAPAVAQLRPVFIKSKGMDKGTYVRIGAADERASEDHLKRFSVAAQGGAETIAYEGKSFKDHLDLGAANGFIRELNKAKSNIYQQFSLQEVYTSRGLLIGTAM